MSDKQVANLIGGVEFKVDLTQLERLFAELQKTERKLRAFGKFAEKPLKIAVQLDTKAFDKQMRELEAKIRKQVGLPAPNAPATQSQRTLDRAVAQQLRLEKLTQQARRSTFQAELAQSKLSFANQKEDVALGTTKIRQLQQQAVLQAKIAQASRQEISTQTAAANHQAQLTANKTKQARLETMLVASQEKAARAATQSLQQQTLLQRAQLALAGFKEQERRKDINHANRLQDRRERAARAEAGQERQRARFRFAEEKHTAWQARQTELAARKAAGVNGGFSMLGALGRSGLPVAGLAAGGLVAGIQQLLSMAGQRIEQRQQGASDSQQLQNIMAAASSQDEGMSGYVQQRFVDFSQKYGTEISLDTAKDFRNGILKQRGQGNSLEHALELYEQQAAAFRGAGMSADESRRANLQLTQVRAKGYAGREDLNTFTEAAPILRGYIEKAWAERNKFKGTAEQRQGAVIASTEKGNLKSADFNRAIELYVAENQKVIQAQAQSIQANEQRLANDRFLQEAQINNNEKLVESVNRNIDAHRQLTEAMGPLKNLMMEFDTSLTQTMAAMAKGAADFIEKPSVGSGSPAGGTVPTADDFVKLTGGDPEKFKQPGSGLGLIDLMRNWWNNKLPATAEPFQLNAEMPKVDALTYLAPQRSSDYTFGFDPKKVQGMVDGLNNTDRNARQMLSNVTNNNSTTVQVAGSTFVLEFPNVKTLDESVVEDTVKRIGQEQMRQYETDLRSKMAADQVPR
ncbi:coiled-coil domain-containing protein [Pseudomonas oryzihabitans]|uniref:hypothetical protein n=1 Tax=Pseudomonas oryzihabitans TaxID=47885 RepID=UPI00362AB80A